MLLIFEWLDELDAQCPNLPYVKRESVLTEDGYLRVGVVRFGHPD
jgi:hypothetical protein